MKALKVITLFQVIFFFLCVQNLAVQSLAQSLEEGIKLQSIKLEQAIPEYLSQTKEYHLMLSYLEQYKEGLQQEGKTSAVYLYGGALGRVSLRVNKYLKNKEQNKAQGHLPRSLIELLGPFSDIDIAVDIKRNHLNGFLSYLNQNSMSHLGRIPKWELITLNFENERGLLNNKNFINQNMDSFSSGKSPMSYFKGNGWARDIIPQRPQGQDFLSSVKNQVNYYFDSPDHETTTNYIQGRNPKIISAIKYISNIIRFDLEYTEKDFEQVKKIVRRFKLQTKSDSFDGSYVLPRLDSVLTQAFLESSDIQKSLALLEKLNIIQALKGHTDYNFSFFYWKKVAEERQTQSFRLQSKNNGANLNNMVLKDGMVISGSENYGGNHPMMLIDLKSLEGKILLALARDLKKQNLDKNQEQKKALEILSKFDNKNNGARAVVRPLSSNPNFVYSGSCYDCREKALLSRVFMEQLGYKVFTTFGDGHWENYLYDPKERAHTYFSLYSNQFDSETFNPKETLSKATSYNPRFWSTDNYTPDPLLSSKELDTIMSRTGVLFKKLDISKGHDHQILEEFLNHEFKEKKDNFFTFKKIESIAKRVIENKEYRYIPILNIFNQKISEKTFLQLFPILIEQTGVTAELLYDQLKKNQKQAVQIIENVLSSTDTDGEKAYIKDLKSRLHDVFMSLSKEDSLIMDELFLLMKKHEVLDWNASYRFLMTHPALELNQLDLALKGIETLQEFKNPRNLEKFTAFFQNYFLSLSKQSPFMETVFLFMKKNKLLTKNVVEHYLPLAFNLELKHLNTAFIKRRVQDFDVEVFEKTITLDVFEKLYSEKMLRLWNHVQFTHSHLYTESVFSNSLLVRLLKTNKSETFNLIAENMVALLARSPSFQNKIVLLEITSHIKSPIILKLIFDSIDFKSDLDKKLFYLSKSLKALDKKDNVTAENIYKTLLEKDIFQYYFTLNLSPKILAGIFNLLLVLNTDYSRKQALDLLAISSLKARREFKNIQEKLKIQIDSPLLTLLDNSLYPNMNKPNMKTPSINACKQLF